MNELVIDNIKAQVPIIQGGMGVSVSLSGLASAVARQGGVGVISATGIGMNESDFFSDFMKANRRMLSREIRLARKKTSGVIGVNLMLALTDYPELLKTAYDEEVDLVFAGAGLPLRFPDTISIDRVKNAHTRFVPIISSGRAAKIIFKSWIKNYDYIPDALVVEGPRAGGHLGFKLSQIDSPQYTLEKILKDVLEVAEEYGGRYEKNIPVIAAGGIYTGEDIYRVFNIGASGVQMGTRFVPTEECDAADEFKNMYVNCSREDIKIIKSPVGLPGRAIMNDYLQKISNGYRHEFSCPCQCLRTCNFSSAPYCIALALTNACRGKLDQGFAFAGSNAWRTDKIISVKELFRELKEGYKKAEKKDKKGASSP